MNRRKQAIGVGVLVACAFLLRAYASVRAFHASFDNSTVGVMACDILKGARPLFYYGQHYMGSLEAYVAAALFRLFGRSLFTLSLAPILFSLLWIVATWWLIRQLYGTRPALGAAAVLAVPGWYALWFNIAPYGGYPGSFFFGTLAAAVTAFLWQREPGGRQLLPPLALLGLATGLAVWTNFLSVPWLVLAAVALVPFIYRHRSDPWLWGAAALGAVLLAIAAWPVLSTIQEYSGDPVASWHLHRGLFAERWNDFLKPGIEAMEFSRAGMPRWWRLAVSVTLAAGAVQYALLLFCRTGRSRRLMNLLPLVFIGVFLLISLPHDLAATHAYRYLIPFWSALCIAVFALPLEAPNRRLRLSAGLLLVLWCLLQGGGIVVQAERESSRKRTTIEARDRVREVGSALGHPPALVVGDRVLGYRAMNHNFWSGGASLFASAFDDRNRRVSEAVERSRHHVLATAPQYAELMENTLKDLGVPYNKTDANALVFCDPLVPPSRAGASIQPLQAWLEDGNGQSLPIPEVFARNWEGELMVPYAAKRHIRLVLPDETTVDSLVLFSTDPYEGTLPSRLRVTALDRDGARTLEKDIGPRFSSGFVEDGRVFMKGYFGVMEIALEGARAASVLIEPLEGSGNRETWSVDEIFVFARREPAEGSLDAALSALVEEIRRGGDTFVMAPRSLSAWLNATFADRRPPIAFPRYNPRYPDTLISRFFQPGMTLAVGAKYASEVLNLLERVYGPEVIADQKSLPPWHLIRTRANTKPIEPARLVWTGHTLLLTDGLEPVWHLP